MIAFLQSAAPYLAAVGALCLLGLMIAFGSEATKEALRSEYETFLRNMLAIAGPTAAAAIGDLALSASRPARLAEAGPNARWAYLFSRWASWILFGLIGGGIVAISGWPPIAAYMAAGVAGGIGTNVVNIVFNWMLGRLLPPIPSGVLSDPEVEDERAQ